MKYVEEAKQLRVTYGPRSGQASSVQGELIRCIDSLRRDGIKGDLAWGDKFVYYCKYIWSILGTWEKFSDKTCAEINSDLNRIVESKNLFIEEALYDRLSDYITEYCLENKEPILFENQILKAARIFMSVIFLFIGLADLLGGATADSRFYTFDDMFIRVIGFIFVASCVGLFFKKEIARKGVTFALVLSIAEIFIGLPLGEDTGELISDIILFLIIFVGGIVFFNIPRIKGCFKKPLKKGTL